MIVPIQIYAIEWPALPFAASAATCFAGAIGINLGGLRVNFHCPVFSIHHREHERHVHQDEIEQGSDGGEIAVKERSVLR